MTSNPSPAPEVRVLGILRQRFPILMVDKVLSWELGGVLKALKNVSANEIHFLGHFPGFPVFPGVLTIECFAQACVILVRLTENAEGKSDESLEDVIGTVSDFRFLKPVSPGDQLETHVRITKTMGNNRIMEGQCLVAGESVATGKLLVGKVKKPQE